jgi:chitinase
MKLLPTLLLFIALQSAFSQEFKVVGYFPTYRFSWLNSVEFDRLTHVNIAFANPDSLGNLSCEGVNIDPVIAKAHLHGCKVFVSLAGGYLSPAAETAWNTLALPANRPAYIQKIVQYVQLHNLDGVDLDLEWDYVKDWYSPFVLELKMALSVYNLPLTVALPGSYRYPKITNAALASFDWVNMMIYDLKGPWDPSNPGQHAPYNWAVQCVQYWKNQNVPANKLTLGVPFYGYDFSTSPVSSFTYRGIVSQNTANAYLDETDQKFWNGIPTIKAKTELALAEVSGIMIWEIGQDAFGANASYSLLRAIDEVVVASSVRVSDLEDQLLKVFPNPVHGLLTIELPSIEPERIVVRDVHGQVLIDRNGTNKTLETNQLDAGFYLLYVYSGNVIYSGKFLKM